MQGRAFMGPYTRPAPRFNFGFRGRMDERYDLVRSVTDGRYVYLRNYWRHVPHGQRVSYMFETPTTQVWKRLFDEGGLPPAQAQFWQPKPAEELYDLHTDPDEVHNLARSDAHQQILVRFRDALQQHLLTTRDLGFLPEAERERRRATTAPYDFGHDPARYPLERILEVAEAASSDAPFDVVRWQSWLEDPESGVRYWAVMGCRLRGTDAVRATHPRLRGLLTDASPSVRIAAADTLGQFDESDDFAAALELLARLAAPNADAPFVALEALNALDQLGFKARSVLPALRTFPGAHAGGPERTQSYVPRLIEEMLRRSLSN
jgi:uncharacterized sulfatase